MKEHKHHMKHHKGHHSEHAKMHEHHKMHKSKHEHGHHMGMIDNRMVHSTRQAGIERVLQRKSEKMRADVEGHHGSMAGGWKHSHHHDKGSSSHWDRSGDSLTPRRG
jgi:hypothetical protein